MSEEIKGERSTRSSKVDQCFPRVKPCDPMFIGKVQDCDINTLVGFDPDGTTIVLQFDGKSILSRVLTFSTSDPYTASFLKLEVVVGLGY